MGYTIKWDICDLDIEAGDEAEAFLIEQATITNNWGTRGFAVWIGPQGCEHRDMPLRIDMNADVGAAAVQWIPDGLVAITEGFGYDGPIRVIESSDNELVEISAGRVRADLETARRVAAEYATTGRRPVGVEWMGLVDVEGSR